MSGVTLTDDMRIPSDIFATPIVDHSNSPRPIGNLFQNASPRGAMNQPISNDDYDMTGQQIDPSRMKNYVVPLPK